MGDKRKYVDILSNVKLHSTAFGRNFVNIKKKIDKEKAAESFLKEKKYAINL